MKNSDTNYNHSYSNDVYYSQLIKDLEEYIQNELQDAAYYETLAKLAPTYQEKTIILSFSKDEAAHAKSFQEAYKTIQGSYYLPAPLQPIVIFDFEQALQERIYVETQAYQQYGEQYLKAPTKYLQDLFFNTRIIEAQHAMRIPFLFKAAV